MPRRHRSFSENGSNACLVLRSPLHAPPIQPPEEGSQGQADMHEIATARYQRQVQVQGQRQRQHSLNRLVKLSASLSFIDSTLTRIIHSMLKTAQSAMSSIHLSSSTLSASVSHAPCHVQSSPCRVTLSRLFLDHDLCDSSRH